MREPARLPVGPPRPLWRLRDPAAVRQSVLTGVAFFLLGLVVYTPGIAHPASITFDEIHYVKVARGYHEGQFVNLTEPNEALPYNYEHPPLAKYLMFASIGVLGDNAAGWRLPSVLLGAAGLAGAYTLGRRLFDSETAGIAAGVLLLLDNQYYLHSGMAMLEIYPAVFSLWAFALAIGPANEARASGLVFGMAVASKYNSLFLLPLFVAVHWLRAPSSNKYVRAALAGLWAVALPFAVWLLTYLPMFAQWASHGGAGYALAQFFLSLFAAFAWDFAAHIPKGHPYSSHPITWLAMVRPVHYYALDPSPTMTAHIYSVGNAALWWPGVALAAVALVAVPWRFLRAHGRMLGRLDFWTHLPALRLSWTPEARWLLAGLYFLLTWAPYLVFQRILFHYYMTFSVPAFALLGGGAVALAVRRWRNGPSYVAAYGAVVVVLFVFYLPLSEGFAIPRAWFDAQFTLIPWMRR